MKKLNTQRIWSKVKPINYREQQVTKLKNYRIAGTRQGNLPEQTAILQKYRSNFQTLKKSKEISQSIKNPIKDESQCTILNKQVEMQNELFHSVFTPKKTFNLKDVETENPTLKSFNNSKTTIHLIVSSLDITKSRGPNGLPSAFFTKTSRNIREVPHKLIKSIKRVRKIPDK